MGPCCSSKNNENVAVRGGTVPAPEPELVTRGSLPTSRSSIPGARRNSALAMSEISDKRVSVMEINTQNASFTTNKKKAFSRGNMKIASKKMLKYTGNAIT